ncbi:MAG: tetratricopeptide repeat protein [Gammaproteobacteria bacterium]|nr:tetratricopeptide repeat protein [Gammaproteobacteria bacterium]
MKRPLLTILHLPLALFLIAPHQSLAEKSAQDARPLLSETTYQALADVHTMTEKGDYQEALAALQKLGSQANANPYEAAVINQNLGYVYHALGDYPKAIDAFERALNTGLLPQILTHSLTYNLAQLLIYTKAYREGLQYLNEWLKNEPAPSSEPHILAASAYYQLEQYGEAIPHARIAVQQVSEPNESWYQLLLACYYQLSMYENAATLLEEMIVNFPKERSYWLQLTGVYQQLKREKQALAILELAYSQDMLDEHDLLRLAQLYLYMEMPYKAGGLLATELKAGRIKKTKENLELLANSWLLAQEKQKAADALQQAAQVAEDGTLLYQLGRIYVDLERWGEAITALQASTKTSGLDDPADAYLLLGIAAYRLGNNGLATKAFTKAVSYDKTKSQADWWLQQLAIESDPETTDRVL